MDTPTYTTWHHTWLEIWDPQHHLARLESPLFHYHPSSKVLTIHNKSFSTEMLNPIQLRRCTTQLTVKAILPHSSSASPKLSLRSDLSLPPMGPYNMINKRLKKLLFPNIPMTSLVSHQLYKVEGTYVFLISTEAWLTSGTKSKGTWGPYCSPASHHHPRSQERALPGWASFHSCKNIHCWRWMVLGYRHCGGLLVVETCVPHIWFSRTNLELWQT